MDIFETIRNQEQSYVDGKIKIGKYVDWSMYETIQTIGAYLNSVHISGKFDSLGREKPFFNIVVAASNIWYRATDLDRKDITIIPTKAEDKALALCANVLLQDWMTRERFGHFLNQWGRTLAKYGSAVVKFTKKDGRLTPVVVSWDNLIVDAVDFNANPVIEKYYLTPSQLRKNKNYDQEKVEELIESVGNRETLDKQDVDEKSNYIEIYEIHGELPKSFLTENDEDDDEYSQQVHIVSYIETDSGYQDFGLYKGKEEKTPYMITHLIPEQDRSLSVGSVEYLFDAQWMVNHTVKQTKDYLDLASKLIFQTADNNFAGRNVLTHIEQGEILRHQPNMPLTQVNNSAQNITALQNYGSEWKLLSKELTSTPDSLRGGTMPSGTPYSLGALLSQQAGSLFEVMTENKGLYLEDMLREFIIPFIKTKMDTADEIGAILDDKGLAEIDSMYIPRKAIRKFNEEAVDKILNDEAEGVEFNQQQAEDSVKKSLATLGNMRFIKPSDVDDKTWKEALKDFEWKVITNITNEVMDKQSVLTTLSTVLQTIASNPQILQDPNAKMLFGKILDQTAIISPVEFSAIQTPMQNPQDINLASGGSEQKPLAVK